MAALAQSGLDRRRAARYELRLPVIFHWRDRGDQICGAFTRDISTGGMFVFSHRCPAPGSEISIEVVLPQFPLGDTDLKLECVGRVNRLLGAASASNGFAISGSFDEERLARLVKATSY